MSRVIAIAILVLSIGAANRAIAAETAGSRMEMPPAEALRPVVNEVPAARDEVSTLRWFRIRKGSFPEFLRLSQEQVWPYFEKIGVRTVGLWQVVPPAGEAAAADYDEAWMIHRYASYAHWQASREPGLLGGNGPDYVSLRDGLAKRGALTLESRVHFLRGFHGPNPPFHLPGVPVGDAAAP